MGNWEVRRLDKDFTVEHIFTTRFNKAIQMSFTSVRRLCRGRSQLRKQLRIALSFFINKQNNTSVAKTRKKLFPPSTNTNFQQSCRKDDLAFYLFFLLLFYLWIKIIYYIITYMFSYFIFPSLLFKFYLSIGLRYAHLYHIYFRENSVSEQSFNDIFTSMLIFAYMR